MQQDLFYGKPTGYDFGGGAGNYRIRGDGFGYYCCGGLQWLLFQFFRVIISRSQPYPTVFFYDDISVLVVDMVST